MPNKKTDDKKKTTILIAMVVCFLVAIIALVSFLFTQGSETHISENRENTEVSSLSCKASNGIDDAFFSPNNAESHQHEIRVTYSGDKPEKIAYLFSGEYTSEDEANTANAEFHADYNKYMAKNNPDSLSPNFSVVNGVVKISLYSAVDNLTSGMGEFFFLDSSEVSNLKTYSYEKLESLYKSKGFSCEYND